MARLTDQEKQDIIRHLDAEKPLPDKYRFLLFEDKREVELVWNGKTSEVCNIVLPFQIIEQVDEPRAEKPAETSPQMDLFTLDTRGRQLKGWTNKLIWGDNKLILSSLKNGPLREEIEKQGGLKLIYIDPPFDVGADFSMDIEIGDDTFTKKPSIIEEIAYRDTWGRGADSFISMIYERLIQMRDLMAYDGSIYVHCDWRVNSLIRLVMDEIFGSSNFRNEIILSKTRKNYLEGIAIKSFNTAFDTLFLYAKNSTASYNPVYITVSREDRWHSLDAPNWTNSRPNLVYEIFGILPPKGRCWAWLKEKVDDAIAEGKVRANPSTGKPEYLIPASDKELVNNLWVDFNSYSFGIGYPTEKSEKLLDRIIKASSNEGDHGISRKDRDETLPRLHWGKSASLL